MINRPTDLLPKDVNDELIRLAKQDPHWVKHIRSEQGTFHTTVKPTWLNKDRKWKAGDSLGMYAQSMWLANGPKIFRPSLEQCIALEQIEVRLQLHDYIQPYPTILIDLPSKRYPPFTAVLCHKTDDILIMLLLSEDDHKNDICTTVISDDRSLEEIFHIFDKELQGTDCTKNAPIVDRIAVNACLALTNFGCHADLLFPKEVVRDKGLANEQSPRGQAAKERVRTAPKLISFDQEVVLHKEIHHSSDSHESTGKEVTSHWRRGHWAIQPYGPGNSLRKRILRPPVLVRADKMLGDVSQLNTVYVP